MFLRMHMCEGISNHIQKKVVNTNIVFIIVYLVQDFSHIQC